MAFPTSPTNGQQATVNGIVYIYNSTTRSWRRVTQLPGVQGSVDFGSVTDASITNSYDFGTVP